MNNPSYLSKQQQPPSSNCGPPKIKGCDRVLNLKSNLKNDCCDMTWKDR